MMNIREQIQESLEGYKLKTNDELIDIISDFGCGETEFHTADIERLITENEQFQKEAETSDKPALNIGIVSISLPSDEEIEEGIAAALLAHFEKWGDSLDICDGDYERMRNAFKLQIINER